MIFKLIFKGYKWAKKQSVKENKQENANELIISHSKDFFIRYNQIMNQRGIDKSICQKYIWVDMFIKWITKQLVSNRFKYYLPKK